MSAPVAAQQAAAAAYVDSLGSRATDLINAVNTAYTNVTYPTWTFTPPAISGAIQARINVGTTPVATKFSGTKPTAVIIPSITAPVVGNLVDFTMVAPILPTIATPSEVMPQSPGTAPGFNPPVMPPTPDVNFPPVPTFENLPVLPAPVVTIPTFTTGLVLEDIPAPTEVFSYVEQPYKDALLDSLKAKLIGDMLNGGYGIEPLDEATLWQREADREMRAVEANVQEANRQAAARGFMLPPGALFYQMESARQDGLAKISSASRDVALKRADMYVDNRRFTITQAKEVEQMLITYFGYMMERALNNSKAIVELGLRSYDAKLARLKFYVERENARAQVYEVVLKAALANLEAYKIQLEGTRLVADIQRLHADIYTKQIEGVNALVNVYRTEMEASKISAEIEQIKLAAFKLSVDTYSAQVGAKAVEFGLYEAKLKGQSLLVQNYQAQTQAYGTTVEAYNGKLRAGLLSLEAQIKPLELKLEGYRTDIARYQADLQFAQSSTQNDAMIFDSKVRYASIDMEAALKSAEQSIEVSRANATLATNVASVAAHVAIAQATETQALAQTSSQVHGNLAGIYATAAGTALSSAAALAADITSL